MTRPTTAEQGFPSYSERDHLSRHRSIHHAHPDPLADQGSQKVPASFRIKCLELADRLKPSSGHLANVEVVTITKTRQSFRISGTASVGPPAGRLEGRLCSSTVSSPLLSSFKYSKQEVQMMTAGITSAAYHTFSFF